MVDFAMAISQAVVRLRQRQVPRSISNRKVADCCGPSSFGNTSRISNLK